jgi:hypothetical protein
MFRMNNRSYVRSISQALALLAVLAGCGSPGLVWQQANINGEVLGALNVGNTRPPMQQSCGTSRFMSPHGTVCSYAFIDSKGLRIDAFQLLDQIDAVAEKLTPLSPWVNKINDRKDGRLFPYKMHLLTVSPAIVLVVPRKPSEQHEFCGFLLRTGCLQSQSFRGNSYWFHGNPSSEKGSFWFNVNDPHSIAPLQLGATVTIESSGALIRLVSTGSELKVYRDK